MKNQNLKFLAFVFALLFSLSAKAQSGAITFPESFTITKKEYNSLLDAKAGKTIKAHKNKYLDGATVTMNQKVVENKQVRLTLPGLNNAELVILINGKDSTIIYILAQGKDVSYKGVMSNKEIVFTKDLRDAIISE